MPDSRVLDIGAGPGTLAIPLAKKVSHVTAVEPADGMMEVLHENISEQGIENINCVQRRWEDIDVKTELEGHYDVVVASFSLGMPDIKDSIQKMEAASSKYVYLYWFAGETSWECHSRILWPLLYGTDYCPGPKCDVLYNVLYQMGIYPDMQVFSYEHINRFSSMDEAVVHFKSHYKITTDHQESILRDYLQDQIEEDNDSLIIRGISTRVKIWWKKDIV